MIKNKTTKEVVSKQELICKSIFSQMRGLMFRKKKKNLIMVFSQERRISLHNCFVFYPIDVIVLDKNKKVVEIKENFKPFKFWYAKQKGKYLIELGKEKSKNKVKLGDLIEF